MAILGILATAAISLLNPLAQLQKGRDAKRKSDLKTLQTAMETYKVRSGSYATV
jgi:type II secretory pathway pseudopilin PulG